MFRPNFGQLVPKKRVRKQGGTHWFNIAGPAAPLGGGRSDFSPLVLELMLGQLNADPISCSKIDLVDDLVLSTLFAGST